MSDGCIAVVGATGLVGREALAILAERGYHAKDILALGSHRSAGTSVAYADAEIAVHELTPSSLADARCALFCADAAAAFEHAVAASEAGTTVIDNSSAFRLDPAVPLVIPEINGGLLAQSPPPRLIANPNCSTIILLTAVEPLRRMGRIRSVTVATYQAVSGAGLRGIAELRAQTKAIAHGDPPVAEFFPYVCAGNVFPHESAEDPATGLNGEESKIIAESNRIWGEPLHVSPTCVRVPVERVHSQAIDVRLEGVVTREQVVELLASAKGVRVWSHRPPTPHDTAGTDEVHVGRIRCRRTDDETIVSLWVCADQLRKGAALNAIQIMSAIDDR